MSQHTCALPAQRSGRLQLGRRQPRPHLTHICACQLELALQRVRACALGCKICRGIGSAGRQNFGLSLASLDRGAHLHVLGECREVCTHAPNATQSLRALRLASCSRTNCHCGSHPAHTPTTNAPTTTQPWQMAVPPRPLTHATHSATVYHTHACGKLPLAAAEPGRCPPLPQSKCVHIPPGGANRAPHLHPCAHLQAHKAQ